MLAGVSEKLAPLIGAFRFAQKNRSGPKMHTNKGFTLIEMMVTIAVAAILLALAIPSFRDTIVRSRIASVSNDFMGALNFARSEAVKRGRRILICKSSSGTGCTESAQWESGWMAFEDKDADYTLDSGEAIVRVWSSIPATYTLRQTGSFPSHIGYDSYGQASKTGAFAVCHDSTEAGASTVVVTRTRARFGQDGNGDRIPETDTGNNINTCETP